MPGSTWSSIAGSSDRRPRLQRPPMVPDPRHSAFGSRLRPMIEVAAAAAALARRDAAWVLNRRRPVHRPHDYSWGFARRIGTRTGRRSTESPPSRAGYLPGRSRASHRESPGDPADACRCQTPRLPRASIRPRRSPAASRRPSSRRSIAIWLGRPGSPPFRGRSSLQLSAGSSRNGRLPDARPRVRVPADSDATRPTAQPSHPTPARSHRHRARPRSRCRRPARRRPARMRARRDR